MGQHEEPLHCPDEGEDGPGERRAEGRLDGKGK